MPGAFSVILTDEGAFYAPAGFGMATFGEEQQKEAMQQAIDSISSFIDKQIKLENDINKAIIDKGQPGGLQALLNARTNGEARLFKQKRKDIDKQQRNLAINKKEYEKAKNKLNKVSQNYYAAIQKAVRTMGKLVNISGFDEKQIQALIDELESCADEVSQTERSFYESFLDLDQKSSAVQERNEAILEIGASMAEKQTMTVEVSEEGIKVEMPKGRHKKDVEEAFKKLNDDIKHKGKDTSFEKIENAKYTTRKNSWSRIFGKKELSPAAEIRVSMDRVVNALKKYLKAQRTSEKKAEDRAKAAVYDFVRQYGIQPDGSFSLLNGTLTIPLNDPAEEDKQLSSLVGGYIEVQYVSNINSIEDLIPNMTAEAVHTGGKATRTIQIKGKATVFPEKKELPKYLGVDTDGLNSLQNDAENLGKYYNSDETTTVQDKVDDFVRLVSKEDNEEYILAFSDKLYSSFGNFGTGNIHIVNNSNLLNSKDLFQGADSSMPVDSLFFTMLNMSTASIYSDEGTKESIRKYVQNMISAHFADLAFNKSNFIKTFNENRDDNVLYISNINNFYVPASRTLQAVKRQLEAGDLIEQVVKAEVQFDTAHSGSGLYEAALAAVPPRGYIDSNKDARWAYVANQVAQNTKINVSMNLGALAQLFSY